MLGVHIYTNISLNAHTAILLPFSEKG